MVFGRSTRHALHSRRPPLTLLPASQEKKPAHRTVLIALDLTVAFDNVDHQHLLDCVFNTNIPATICRWLYNYIHNRRVKFHFRQKESKSRKVKQEWYKEEFCLQRSSITIWPSFLHRLRTISTPMTLPSAPVVVDLINGLNIYLR